MILIVIGKSVNDTFDKYPYHSLHVLKILRAQSVEYLLKAEEKVIAMISNHFSGEVSFLNI